jgi:hypothetical protein
VPDLPRRPERPDTPVSAYASFGGVRVVGQAEARYLENGTQSAYGRFTITGAEFNVRAP